MIPPMLTCSICKLLLLRTAELLKSTSTSPPHHHIIHTETVSHLKQTTNALITQYKAHQLLSPPSLQLSPLASRLHRTKRTIIFVLCYTAQTAHRHPPAERAFLVHRLYAFLHPKNHAYARAVRREIADLERVFDYCADSLRPGSFAHRRLVAHILPAFSVSFPAPADLQTCSICRDDYNHADLARRFSLCSHPFHALCLDRYVFIDTCIRQHHNIL